MRVDPRKLYPECIECFRNENYDIAIRHGRASLERATPELLLIILISLQRTDQREVLKALGDKAIAACSDLPFDKRLLEFTLDYCEVRDVMELARTPFQRCRAYYYAASHYLFTGKLDLAIQAYQACLNRRIDCLETNLALVELKRVAPPGSFFVDEEYARHEEFSTGYGEPIFGGIASGGTEAQDGTSKPESKEEPLSAPTATRWGEIRVFVASTFADMHAERDLLVRRVFPQLRKQCAERRLSLVEVDLRWGITDERQSEVLDICRREVARCNYFICLLAERSVWVAETILDELGVSRPSIVTPNDKSMTAIEILHQLARPDGGNRTFFYLRGPSSEIEWDPRVTKMKDCLREKGVSIIREYDHEDSLAMRVLADLWHAIDRDHPPSIYSDEGLRKRAEHEAFAARHVRTHCQRESYLNRIEDFVRAEIGLEQDKPLAIIGPAGAGKSALLAAWVDNHRRTHPTDWILEHYIGATPDSTTFQQFLCRAIEEICRVFPPAPAFKNHYLPPDDLRDIGRLVNAFRNCLNLITASGVGRRFVIVLDGLNHLDPNRDAHALGWLPRTAPYRVHIIVSSSPGRCAESIKERDWKQIQIDPFSADEVRSAAIVRLSTWGKELSSSRLEKIVSSAASSGPLYLRLLLDELRVCARHESLEQVIHSYLLAQDETAMYEKMLARLEADHEPGLVRNTLSLFRCAYRGLSETELFQALGNSGDPLPAAIGAPLLCALENELADHGGLRYIVQKQLIEVIDKRYLSTDQDRRDTHQKLAAYFERLELDERKIDELPWQLRSAGDWKRLAELLGEMTFFEAMSLDQERLVEFWKTLEKVEDPVPIYESTVAQARASGMDADPLGALLFCVMNLLARLNRTGPAIQFCREALACFQSAFGDEHAVTAMVRSRLGSLLLAVGDVSAARVQIEGALLVQEREFGPLDPRLALYLELLGDLHIREKNLERAEQIHQRVYEIRAATFGYVKEQTVASLIRLAILYFLRGNLAGAYDYAQRILHANEQLGQRDDPSTFRAMDVTAEVLRVTKRYPEAAQLFASAIERKGSVRGVKHPSVAFSLVRLALVQFCQGDTDAAVAHCHRAMVLCEQTLPKNHPYRVEVDRMLAHLNADPLLASFEPDDTLLGESPTGGDDGWQWRSA